MWRRLFFAAGGHFLPGVSQNAPGRIGRFAELFRRLVNGMRFLEGTLAGLPGSPGHKHRKMGQNAAQNGSSPRLHGRGTLARTMKCFPNRQQSVSVSVLILATTAWFRRARVAGSPPIKPMLAVTLSPAVVTLGGVTGQAEGGELRRWSCRWSRHSRSYLLQARLPGAMETGLWRECRTSLKMMAEQIGIGRSRQLSDLPNKARLRTARWEGRPKSERQTREFAAWTTKRFMDAQ